MLRALVLLLALLVLSACDTGAAPGTPGSFTVNSGGEIDTFIAAHSTR